MTSGHFDIGTGIFFFFKRFGERPGGAMWLILCQILLVFVACAAGLALAWPAVENLGALAEAEKAGGLSEAEATQRALGIAGPLIGIAVLIMPVAIIIALMLQGAWMRFLTRDEIKPVIPYRLGGDELRLLGVNILYVVVGIALYVAAAIVMLVFGFGGGAIIGANEGSIGAGMGGGLLIFLGVVLGLALAVFIAVKLATAPALTVLDRKFRFFESWDASSGVFWHMLLTYFVVGIFVMVISMIVSTIVQLVALGAVLPAIGELSLLESQLEDGEIREVMAALGDAFSSPTTLILLGIAFVVSYAAQIIYEGMWHGVGAYNAVRYRASDAPSQDAPVLEADHPLGATPSEN
ncbi:hypothetical protein [Maricaulis sp. CAU 1757]